MKGFWSSEEDDILREYVKEHGEGKWHLIEKNSVLSRSGKSCRLRWLDHLRPDLKKGLITIEEEKLLIELHKNMGNKWAQIAKHFPGRTDNELKNFWHKRIRKCGGIGLPVYPVDEGSSRVSDQNHQQQINGLSPSGDVFNSNIISNSIAADEDQSGRRSKRQKYDRNSTCSDHAVDVENYEASDRDDLNSENIEDFFNSLEFDIGVIMFQDPSLCENNEILENSEEEHVPAQLDVSMPDEAATDLELSKAINYELPSVQNDHHFECEPKNTADIVENNEILDDSEASEPLIVAGLENKHVLSQQDFSMSYEGLEETRLKKNYLVANSNPTSEDEIATLQKQVCCNEHKTELYEAVNYEQPLAQEDDHHFKYESLNTSLPQNPATIIENNEILEDSEDEHLSVAGLMDEHILPQSDFWMPDELLEEILLKENYLRANSTPMSEDEIATLLEQVCWSEHKMELSETINCEQPLAQDDHYFDCESLNTTTSLPENPSVINENNEILDNSVVRLADEHVLSQLDFSMPYEQLEETQLKEDGLANFNPMSEDEIAFLKQDFGNEHKMTLSEAINCEHPLAQYDSQFESHSGDAAKEATAVDAEPLPIATMEESLEQIWSNHSWNEFLSGCDFAMDWELDSIQNNEFDSFNWDDIFSHDV